MEVSREEQEELLRWLFGENVEILQEEDITLSSYFKDDNIYYTKEIYELFQTKALKREGKIMQLGSEIFCEPNIYHTRLEHSKGAYRNCVQFLALQYRKPEWRKYIEENKLKGYLVEKIKFMCVHDIGHAMFSHTIESIIGDENCTHEDIGQRIINENKEVKESLDKIKANEQDSNLEGDGSLESFCEGNIDFDRMDYLARDRVYIGDKTIDEIIFNLSNMCELTYIPEEGAYRYAYKPEAIEFVEKFLETRNDMYKSYYRSVRKEPLKEVTYKLTKQILEGKFKTASEIHEYLSHIVGKPLDEIDLDDFLQTNDILFLNAFISDDEQLKNNKLLKAIIPDSKTLLQIAISLLNPQKSKTAEYDEEEKQFIANIRKLIRKNDVRKDLYLAAKIKEHDYEEIQSKIEDIVGIKLPIDGIYQYKKRFKKYNKNESIYIKDEEGNIYTLDKYPNLSIDLSEEYQYGIYAILPELEEQGLTEEQIQEIKDIIGTYKERNNIEKNRMSMFKTEHGKTNYLDKLNQFFGDER